MFAYCMNSPTNLFDPTGTISWALFGDNHLFNPNMLADFGGGGSSYTSGGVSTQGHHISMKELLDTNSTETARKNLESYGVTFYRGVSVMKVDSMGYGALSFGIILMGGSNLQDPGFSNTLKHEYGHAVHFNQIGPIDYFVTTAIPSLIFAEATNQGAFPDQYYYDLPWERTADQLGGVQRNYLSNSNYYGSAFWCWTLLYSSVTPW